MGRVSFFYLVPGVLRLTLSVHAFVGTLRCYLSIVFLACLVLCALSVDYCRHEMVVNVVPFSFEQLDSLLLDLLYAWYSTNDASDILVSHSISPCNVDSFS